MDFEPREYSYPHSRRALANERLAQDGKSTALSLLSNSRADGREGRDVRGERRRGSAVEVSDIKGVHGTALGGALEAGAED